MWRQLVPRIVQTRPVANLCWECQQNNEAMYRSANLSDDIKSDRVKKQEAHLHVAQVERSLYNNMVHEAKLTAADISVTALGPSKAASRDVATASTMLSKCIFRVTHCSLVQCIFLCQENVVFLEFAAWP